MPTLVELKNNGYNELYHVVKRFGGRKAVAGRLGLNLGGICDIEEYGDFSLSFACELLGVVMTDQRRIGSDPIARGRRGIYMPTREELLEGVGGFEKGRRLDELVMTYVGERANDGPFEHPVGATTWTRSGCLKFAK